MNTLPDSYEDHRVSEEILAAHGYSIRDLERLSDLYDDEVLCSDHYLGQLFQKLHQLGLYQNTIVIITADHGEAFLEHDYIQHCESLYQELINVPLIIAGPGIPGGRQIHELVELVDLTPTILEAAGIPLTTKTSGRSFYQALSGTATITDDIGLADLPAKQMHALRVGKLKLIVSPDKAELYDLSRDPRETTDLASSRPADLARLKQLLRDLLQQRRAGAEVTESPTPRQLKALRTLGYLK